MDLIVVDGPNLYNVVGSRLDGRADAEQIKPFLCRWFDLDRLVLATVGVEHDPALGIVAFHSRRPLGRGSYRLTPEETDFFWGRQGSNPNSSSMVVDIPGAQQETYPFKCERCGASQNHRSSSEKGVDTTITTYLLETSGRWNSVCIVSKDVDFVPPVLALRRHGKRVFCAIEDAASVSALVRACQSSFPIDTDFLASDFGLYRLLMPGGALDRICTTLTAQPGVAFGVHRHPRHHREFMRNGCHAEFWLKHPGSDTDAERIRKMANVSLDTIPEIASLIQWEVRNPQLLVLNLRGPDLLYEGFDRHRDICNESEWSKWERPLDL